MKGTKEKTDKLGWFDVDTEENKAKIAAIVTQNQNVILGGGAPVFLVHDKEELQKISSSLGKILDSAAHEINDQTIIIVAR